MAEPQPSQQRSDQTGWRPSVSQRELGRRLVELHRRFLAGQLCLPCANDRPWACTGTGTACPLDDHPPPPEEAE